METAIGRPVPLPLETQSQPLPSSCDTNNITTTTSTTSTTNDNQNKLLVNENGVPLAEKEEYGTEIMLKAFESFTFLDENEYVGTADGLSLQQESMQCSCQYSPGLIEESDDKEDACGEHCINRMLMVECMARDCPIGEYCQNRRFQKKDYAALEVFQTTSKGYGVRSKQFLPKNSFVIEYVGEIVSAATFRKRTKQYESQGQKHFYFMSLKSDQVIDATMKGGVARFINHSCDPNCVLQKWVVGKYIRMGIFTKRNVEIGQEFTFDYKFERYGAPCQVCLCGSANCKGTIGVSKPGHGSTETLASLSDDEEDDKSQVSNSKEKIVKGLEPDDIMEFSRHILRFSGKPSKLSKYLDKLLSTENPSSLRRFLYMNGLLLLKSALRSHDSNTSICRKILQIFTRLPIQERNKLDDFKVFDVLESLKDHKDPLISTLSQKLKSEWGALTHVYKIPKAPKNPSNRNQTEEKIEKRKPYVDFKDQGQVYGRDNKRFRKSYDRNSYGKDRETRSSSFEGASIYRDRSPEKPQFAGPPRPLPSEWVYSHNSDGQIYYYHKTSLATQWDHPDGMDGQSTESKPMIISNNVPTDIISSIAEAARKAVERSRVQDEQNGGVEDEERKRKKAKKMKEKEKDKGKFKEKVNGEIDEVIKKSLRDDISTVVIGYLSRYKDKLLSEDFKKHARKITHTLIEKASKNCEDAMTEEMKRKIKKFVENYYKDKIQESKSSSYLS